MRNLVVLFIHIRATLVRLLGAAARSLVAKSLVLKHQRVIVKLKPSTHWATSAKLCGKQVLGPRKTASSLRLLRAGGMYRTPAIEISSTSKTRLGALLSIRSGRVVIFDCIAEIERCEYLLAGRSRCH